jgi:cysteine desulfurase
MLAMGCCREAALSGLRLSFSDEHTEDDADQFISALRQVVHELSLLHVSPSARKGKRQ